MSKYIVAFDVDGTLVNNDKPPFVANERIRAALLMWSSVKFIVTKDEQGKFIKRKVHTVVWSGGGAVYAHQAAQAIGVAHYVDEFASKNHVGIVDGEHTFAPDIEPDIAYDDIQECRLGKTNIIVKEK